MADSIVRLRVDSQEYDNKLKRAAEGLNRYIEGCRKAGGTLEHVDEGVKEFTQQLGNMGTVAGGAKGKLGEMTKAFTDLTMQFNQMSEAEKNGQFGKALSAGLDELKQRIISTKQELAGINNSLNAGGSSVSGGLFSSDKLSGMLQVFGGNLMTKGAGMALSFAGEMKDMVAQGIELAKAGEGVRIAFERLGRGDLLDGLREATHGTVTDLELMKAAVKFNDFKLPLDELGTMLAFAQQKAKDTGQSVDYMVDSIVTGLGRKSLMILDNLGLSAAEVKEKMAETGDMTKAVGEIIREQMSKAGDYVETAADRATKANVEVQNAMERLGETLQPLTDAGTSMFNSLKVSALDFINKALRPMINMLTEAGRMRKLYNAQKGTNDAKIQEMLEGLSKSELPQHQHRVNLAYWDKNINKYQQYLTDYKTWQKDNTSVGAYDRMKAFQKETGLSMFSDVKEQLEVFKRQKADYEKLSKDLLTKKVEDNKVEKQSIDSLKKKLQELQAERKKAIEAGDTDLSKSLLKQINHIKTDIKGLGGGTTTTTHTLTKQERAQESFTKAEQNYKQALEKAAMELEAGTINMAQAKQQEAQAAEARWKAIGDARNISDSDRLRQAQDEAAAEYKRLAAEAKTAAEHQKAVDKATRDLENANQKLATARSEMAQAREQGDLQAYNTAKDKATAAQKEITRLEKVKVDVERGRVDLPDIPKVIEQTVNTHQGELMTADIATEITQKINTALGNIVKPEILDEVTQTINTKVGEVITPEVAKEVTQVVNVETGSVDLKPIPTETTTMVDFEANTRNIDAAISDVKKEISTIPVGTIEFNTEQAKLVDLTTLQTLINEAVKKGLTVDSETSRALFNQIVNGDNISAETWQGIVDKFNEKMKAIGGDELRIDYNTGEKKDKKGDKDITESISKFTSGVQSITTGINSLGIEIPKEVTEVINVVNGLMSIIQGVQTIISVFSTTSMAANTAAILANTAALTLNSGTRLIPFMAHGGIVPHAATGWVGGNDHNDNTPIMVSSGELILNKAQQGNLAAQLQNGGMQGMQLETVVSGEQLRFILNSNGRRTMRGEIVTTNFR